MQPTLLFEKRVWNSVIVTFVKLKSLFNQQQNKATDFVSLKLFHKKLKCTKIWLVSMGYKSKLRSTENVTKAA